MEEKNRRERLELNQDLRTTRATWRAERIGWIALAAFLAAALLGLLGPGPLSSAATADPGSPFRVLYDRFGHLESESRLELELQAPGGRGPVGVWLSSDYLAGVEVRGVTPPPDSTRLEPGRVVYVYEAGGEGTRTVRIDLLYLRIGRIRGEAGLAGGPSAGFSHWVYP